jgi:CDP-diacylglycerol--serine O-phosphatidyltransferase
MIRNIPNIITCLNLLCGCLSIAVLIEGRLNDAAYFIFAASVFDFLDGFLARLMKAHSAIGKELDSLADMVSFGLAPATIMLLLLNNSIDNSAFSVPQWIAVFAYIIAVFSALRLAKYNTETQQTESFKGLPTPANAMFICSLVFISSGENMFAMLSGNFLFLMATTAVLSYLLVSKIHLFSLKFKSFEWKSNRIKYLFLAISAIILILLKWAGLSVIISIYIILSIIVNQSKSKVKR